MKIKSFKVKSFENDNKIVSIDVPMLSRYKDMKVFHDGIYAFFEVPDLSIEGGNTERYTYKLVGVNESIPENSEFVCLLDAIIELPLEAGETIPRQAIQIMPIYKI